MFLGNGNAHVASCTGSWANLGYLGILESRDAFHIMLVRAYIGDYLGRLEQSGP